MTSHAEPRALISSTSDIRPNHSDLLRIFHNPNESQRTDITQLVSGWTRWIHISSAPLYESGTMGKTYTQLVLDERIELDRLRDAA